MNADQPSCPSKTIPQQPTFMKQALENLKPRTPRLPLPPADPTVAEPAGADRSGNLVPRVVNNGRMRSHYLPPSWHQRGPTADSKAGLDYAFKTRLFWIVSRLNNCHYCLGHQEHKLLVAGLVENQIAALDSRWDSFPASEQAAMALARSMTIAPQEIRDQDIEALRPAYNDLQIVEIVQTIASNNSTNRWTDALGIPQDELFRNEVIELDTPTSPEFATCNSTVALKSLPTRERPCSMHDLKQALLSREIRHPRVPLSANGQSTKPHWIELLSSYPDTSNSFKEQWEAVENDGTISHLLKLQLRWTVARENRSLYALSVAWNAMHHAGVRWEELSRYDEQSASLTPGDAVATEFARKLTVTPQAITDADIAGLRQQFADRKVAEIVYVVCQANAFTRWTETLRLPLDPCVGLAEAPQTP